MPLTRIDHPLHTTDQSPSLQLKLTDFEGPLDLLLTLIEQHQIDIMDIPIARLTQQYMSYLDDLDTLDVDLASAFLVTAADLLRLKSRMLIPKPEHEGEGYEDPRQELVFQLLQYRRMRHMAMHLRLGAAVHQYMGFRLPLAASDLGIEQDNDDIEDALESSFSVDKFFKIKDRLAHRNGLRYQDVSDKLRALTGRERISLKTRIKEAYQSIVRRGKCLFRDLFPREDSRTSRVNGFLAILELVRQRRVEAIQTHAMAEIELRIDPAGSLDDVKTDAIEHDFL